MRRTQGILLATVGLGALAAVGFALLSSERTAGTVVSATGTETASTLASPLASPAPAGARPQESSHPDAIARTTPPSRAVASDPAPEPGARPPLFVVYGSLIDPEGRRDGQWGPSVWMTDAAGEMHSGG